MPMHRATPDRPGGEQLCGRDLQAEHARSARIGQQPIRVATLAALRSSWTRRRARDDPPALDLSPRVHGFRESGVRDLRPSRASLLARGIDRLRRTPAAAGGFLVGPFGPSSAASRGRAKPARKERQAREGRAVEPLAPALCGKERVSPEGRVLGLIYVRGSVLPIRRPISFAHL